MSKRWQISRRRVLRGMGAAIALPMLDAMIPSEALRRAAAFAASPATPPSAAPLRMAAIFFPNGRWMPNWTPADTGANFELPASLAPLESVKKNLLVLSGLTLKNAAALGDGGGDHARSAAAFLTGVHPHKTAGADIRAGVSLDQMIAQHVGEQTRLPSLEMGLEYSAMAGECDSGYSCAYTSHISWRTPQSPMPSESDPGQVFDELFGSDDPNTQIRMKQRSSILDAVAEDAADLNRQLGRADQAKLDEFTTSIREVEKRIDRARQLGIVKPPAGSARPGEIPDDIGQYMRLMFDLLVLAFRTDSTRVATMMTAHEGNNRPYREIGLSEGYHSLSHHGQDPAKIDGVKKIDVYHMKQLAYFLEKLATTPDGDGSLLDHSMILCGSGISDGDRHNHDNLPILLAGRAGGGITPGRHVRYDNYTPLCNLYLSMMKIMGVETPRFGDSTGLATQLA
jgi:hypothetical protein